MLEDGPKQDIKLSDTALPNRRYFLKSSALVLAVLNGHALPAKEPLTEIVIPIPKNTTELMRLIIEEYGEGIKIYEASPKKKASILTSVSAHSKTEDPWRSTNIKAESLSSIIIPSVFRSWHFIHEVPEYFYRYQQEIKGVHP